MTIFIEKPKPSTRAIYLAEEFAQGNWKEKKKTLRWDKVCLNLPGDPAYDVTLPRIIKWDNNIDNIGGDLLMISKHQVTPLRALG
jgi:hypothetical protein